MTVGDQITSVINLLHRVTTDINSAECCLIAKETKEQVSNDARLRSLEKRLGALWQDAYHLRVDFQQEVFLRGLKPKTSES